MTLGPDEIRAALAREEDELARRTSLGNQLTGILLAGLGWLPLYAGVSLRLHDEGSSLWCWLSVLVTAVIIVASAIVTRRDRHHDGSFATFWLATLGVSALVTLGALLAVWGADASAGTTWELSGLLLIAPLVACLGLALTARARR